MFGIGLPELVIIVVIALIFIGPKQLPGVMRSVGKGLVDLKRATNDIRHTVQTEMDNIERDLEVKDIKKDFENNFGSLKLSQMSTGDKLEAVANAFEKGQEDLAARKENVAAAEAKEAESTTTASTADSTVSKTNGTATT